MTAPVNVAQVRQLSPFRYPGGKTWLVPTATRWLEHTRPRVLLEPFAGGAMVGLSAASARAVERVELVERDEDVAAVWEVLLNGSDRDAARLADLVLGFEVTESSVRAVIADDPRDVVERALRTIVKNRTYRGGIMAPGAGLVKAGEGGKGLLSRWYPGTLARRFAAVRGLRDVVGFRQGDAFEAIERHRGAAMFLDPPYTVNGRGPGRRLYTYHEVDHERLFYEASSAGAPVMMTYDDSPDVRALAARYGGDVQTVPMKDGHHRVRKEALIVFGAGAEGERER